MVLSDADVGGSKLVGLCTLKGGRSKLLALTMAAPGAGETPVLLTANYCGEGGVGGMCSSR
jgi:hypothetical protein